jgi:hypothetical protein
MKKMLKKIGLPAIALVGMLAMAPHAAKAAVRIGVVVGRPAYAYPMYPVYPPAPVVAYADGGWVRRDFRRDSDRDRDAYRDRDRGRDFRGRDHDGGGRDRH